LLDPDGARRNSPFGLRHLRTFVRLALCYSPTHDGGNTGERSTHMNNPSSDSVFETVRARFVCSRLVIAAVRSHDQQDNKLFVSFEAEDVRFRR